MFRTCSFFRASFFLFLGVPHRCPLPPRSRFLSAFILLILLISVSCTPKTSSPFFGSAISKTSSQAVKKPESSSTQDIRCPAISLYRVESANSMEIQKFPASVRENRTIHLAFRIPGKIKEVHAEIGQMVREGEVLASLDPRDFLNAKAAAEANLAELQAGLNARIANRDRSVEILRKKRDAAEILFLTAEKNLEKFAQLTQDGAIPEIRFDEMQTQYEQALAGKVAAEKELENAKIGLHEEIRSLEAKKNGLLVQKKQSEDALSDTLLRAPCSGTISQKFMESGEVSAPGVPVLAVTDTSQRLVRALVPESLRIRQEEISAFRCEFEAYPDLSFPAELVFLAPTPQSGTHGYPLEVRVSDLRNRKIFPGMTAVVVVELQPSCQEFRVPLSALSAPPLRAADTIPVRQKLQTPSGSPHQFQTRPCPQTSTRTSVEYDGKYRETVLWRISPEERVIPCRVQIVRLADPGWVIVRGDLQKGEHIAASGAPFLREGQRVRPILK